MLDGVFISQTRVHYKVETQSKETDEETQTKIAAESSVIKENFTFDLHRLYLITHLYLYCVGGLIFFHIGYVFNMHNWHMTQNYKT